MLSFEYNNMTVEINSAFCEGVIKAVSIKEDILEDPVQKIVVTQVMEQENDGTGYYSLVFTVTAKYQSDMEGHPLYLVRACVPKEDVTIRPKWKKVRISEDSLYVGLNDNPKFIEALTKEYNTNYDSYQFYLPVSYKAHLLHKECGIEELMSLHVDIPFSDIEVY